MGTQTSWFCYQQGGKSGSLVKSMSFEGGLPSLPPILPSLLTTPLLSFKWPAQSRLHASPPVASECTPYLPACVCAVGWRSAR